MNRQDSIKALLRAGKRKEVQETIDSYSKRAASKFDQIRSDATRTDDYKRWELAVTSKQIRASLDVELERMAGKVVSLDRADAERVFGVHGLSGDAASLVISRRDAGDRVADIANPGELKAMLARATRTGDEVLARAVAERALQIKQADVLNQFLEDRPHLDEPVERLWAAERATDHGFEVTMQLMAFKPRELADASFSSIDAIADNAEPGTASASAGG